MMEGKFWGLRTKSRLKAFELAIRNGLAHSFSYNKGQQAGRGCVTLCAAILDWGCASPKLLRQREWRESQKQTSQHFWTVWIKNPTDATVCRYLFTAKLLYMFRVSQHPSSGVSKTVPAAYGTGHTTCTAIPLLRGLIGTGLCESRATRTNQSRSDHVEGE